MAIHERIERLSLDELLQLYGSDGPVEYIDGELILVSPTVSGSNFIAHILLFALRDYVKPNKLGEAYVEAAYAMVDTPQWVKGSLIPDVMYYRQDRIDTYRAATPDWREKPYLLVPDLVVEVISPTDLASKLDQKIAQYMKDGVQMLWKINPEQRTVVVHRAGSNQQIMLTVEDTLDAGSVIPGFSIPVASLFE
jgi:Uma2 family endonuclease